MIRENAIVNNIIDDGVVINNVKWATRNIDLTGTFATYPEDAGKFYQWNRKKAWAATDNVTDWDRSSSSGINWEKANDPSPAGWRVPTLAEINTLLDEDKVTNEWITVNGVKGSKFIDKATGNSIFLPTFCRLTSNGYYVGSDSISYWCATRNNDEYVNALDIAGNHISICPFYEDSLRCSIRPVADNDICLDRINLTLYKGDEVKLRATIKTITNPIVTWTSSNPTVAIVNNNGKITTISVGTTIISATTRGMTATCIITVEPCQIDVLINGIRWATRNVDEPGTFATCPEHAGKFYHWNRKKAWNTTAWDDNLLHDSAWAIANDPSPVGFRIPTAAEFDALCDENIVNRECISVNGVIGIKFTDKDTGNSIFLPAFYDDHIGGYSIKSYWSSTQYENDFAYYLDFLDIYNEMNYTRRDISGLFARRFIRCVVESNLNTSNSVLINGVHWAICNVDMPGTFAVKPENTGKIYQWNDKKAWDTFYDDGDCSEAENTWEKANDPSPVGYRLPTTAEFEKLLDKINVINVRTFRNGVKGIKFTEKSTGNSLFLPATGYRSHADFGMGESYYWTGTETDISLHDIFVLLEDGARIDKNVNGTSGYTLESPIRSVVE